VETLQDSMDFWRQQKQYDKLAVLAQDLLYVQAFQAYVNQIFSV